MPGPQVLLLSTADWDAPLWTNKQYMACELAAEFDVVYVESLGLRRPELSMRDLRRMAGRLRRLAIRSTDRDVTDGPTPRPRPSRVEVRTPFVVPRHRWPFTSVNRVSLQRLVRDWRSSGDASRVLWTYSPVTYGLERDARVVYHCVDLLAAQQGIDAVAVRRGEAALVAAGALAIASSREVAVHLRQVGFTEVLEWPNVADVEPFIEATRASPVRDPRLVVFGGNVIEHKVDVDLLHAVLDRVPDVRVVLAGPVAEGAGSEWEGLRSLRRRGVELVGRRTLPELAELFATASVAVVPYAINDYTRGVLPLKVAEYLGAGLPVVSSWLPSLDPVGDDVVLTADAPAFADAVAAALARGVTPDDITRRQALAQQRSWTSRGVMARDLVRSTVAR